VEKALNKTTSRLNTSISEGADRVDFRLSRFQSKKS